MYDPGSGQFLTGSFMDCVMPRAGMIRNMRAADDPVPTKRKMLGTRGVGEVGCGGLLPALVSALDAQDPLRIQGLAMPPNKPWQAMHAAERRI